MMRPLPWLGLLATLALLLAACGGDDTLSDREYFAALEAVSAAAEARDVTIPELSPEADAEAVAAYFDAFQALFVETRADLAALAPPTELTTAHDALVDALDAVIDEIEQVREADADESFADVLSFFTAGGGIDEFNRACVTLHQLAADRDIPFLFDDDCTDG